MNDHNKRFEIEISELVRKEIMPTQIIWNPGFGILESEFRQLLSTRKCLQGNVSLK